MPLFSFEWKLRNHKRHENHGKHSRMIEAHLLSQFYHTDHKEKNNFVLRQSWFLCRCVCFSPEKMPVRVERLQMCMLYW